MSDTSLEPLHKTQLYFPVKPGNAVRKITAKPVEPKVTEKLLLLSQQWTKRGGGVGPIS